MNGNESNALNYEVHIRLNANRLDGSARNISESVEEHSYKLNKYIDNFEEVLSELNEVEINKTSMIANRYFMAVNRHFSHILRMQRGINDFSDLMNEYVNCTDLEEKSKLMKQVIEKGDLLLDSSTYIPRLHQFTNGYKLDPFIERHLLVIQDQFILLDNTHGNTLLNIRDLIESINYFENHGEYIGYRYIEKLDSEKENVAKYEDEIKRIEIELNNKEVTPNEAEDLNFMLDVNRRFKSMYENNVKFTEIVMSKNNDSDTGETINNVADIKHSTQDCVNEIASAVSWFTGIDTIPCEFMEAVFSPTLTSTPETVMAVRVN